MVSHYRDAQSISPIMGIHPHLLKSICFYLMPQLFFDALFFTLNSNLSIHLFFSLPFCLLAEWLLSLSLCFPTEHVSGISPLALGSLTQWKFWLCFFFSSFFFFYIAWNKGRNIQQLLIWRQTTFTGIPFNHKS